MPSEKANKRGVHRLALLSLLVLILLTHGCIPKTIQPASDSSPAKDPLDWSDWALALGKCVENERVNYAKLLQDRQALDRFLSHLSESGPRLTPNSFQNKDAQIAYYANAHNAAVVAGVLGLARNGKLPAKLPPGFEVFAQIRVDGQAMSVDALQSRVISLGGRDWRVRLTLYQGKVVGPDLENRMFLPEMLDARLNMTARAQLASRGVVRVDHGEKKRLYVWDKLFEVRQTLLEQYDRGVPIKDVRLVTALLTWGDADQRNYLNSGIGYEAEAMPEDRTIDAVTGERE